MCVPVNDFTLFKNLLFQSSADQSDRLSNDRFISEISKCVQVGIGGPVDEQTHFCRMESDNITPLA